MGSRFALIGALFLSLYSGNLNFLAPSGCPDWPFSLIPLFIFLPLSLSFGMGFLLLCFRVTVFEPQAVEWVHCKSECLRSSQGNEWTRGASLAELRSAFWQERLLGCQTEAVTTETWHRYVWETIWLKWSVWQSVFFLDMRWWRFTLFPWFLYFKSVIDVYFVEQTPELGSNTLCFVQPWYFTPRCNVVANVFCFTLIGRQIF